MDLKKKIIAAIVVIGITLMIIVAKGFGGDPTPVPDTAQVQTEHPVVVSTNPSPLDEATVLPTQTIEVTYNQPIENRGEVKYEISPETQVKVELSDDRKTIRFIPEKPFELGQGYTLIIKNGTKFDNNKRQDGDKVFHFSTIAYKGV